MKNFSSLLCVFCFFTTFNVVFAQDLNTDNYSSIYERSEDIISNTDTIPDYRSKTKKLKLTGTIYQSDGITPAPDVILFIEQPDEDGNFELRRKGDNRYVFHRSWVKTDADGVYTFYTFVPGNDRRFNQLQQIFPTVKAPNKEEYQLATFLFDEDPLLTKRCRKKIEKMSTTDRILKLKREDGMLVAKKDIILGSDMVAIN